MEETDLGARVDQEEIEEDRDEPCDGQKLLNGGWVVEVQQRSK